MRGISIKVLSKIMQVPAFGKIILKNLKKNAFSAFQVQLEHALEKQEKSVKAKFKRMENTDIGTKLQIHPGSGLESIQFTNYAFYEPFYNNPSPSSFMYPLEEYVRIKTSGTTGKDKWFLIPRRAMRAALRETGLPIAFAAFHDGEKITMEYGDTIYLNMGPAPYISGAMVSMGSKEKQVPFLNLVPNINLSYKQKVEYFTLNHKKIDAAWIMASTLVNHIMPNVHEPVHLKGLMLLDDLVARAYKKEITEFTGVSPKTSYASTETPACSIPSIQYPLGFIFDPRRGVFEFSPLEKDEKSNHRVLGLENVQVGEKYRLYFTDLIGELTRYDTTISFKCIAKGDDLLFSDFPIFEYHSRLDKAISISNYTRITENELITTFKNAGVQFMDFTAKVERESGYEYLHLYVELLAKKSPKEVETAIHQQLYTNDGDYKMLADFFDYVPIRVNLLPKGTIAKFLEQRAGGVPKMTRIDMKEEDFNQLMTLANKL